MLVSIHQSLCYFSTTAGQCQQFLYQPFVRRLSKDLQSRLSKVDHRTTLALARLRKLGYEPGDSEWPRECEEPPRDVGPDFQSQMAEKTRLRRAAEAAVFKLEISRREKTESSPHKSLRERTSGPHVEIVRRRDPKTWKLPVMSRKKIEEPEKPKEVQNVPFGMKPKVKPAMESQGTTINGSRSFQTRGSSTPTLQGPRALDEGSTSGRGSQRGRSMFASRWSGRSMHTSTVGSSSRSTLDLTFPEVPSEIRERRKETLDRVNQCIRKEYGERFDVQTFGSICYGTDDALSDLDLIIRDHERKSGWLPDDNFSKLPSIYDVRRLAKKLRKRGFHSVLPVPAAVVPIVQFTDPKTRIKCDLNVNDRLGIHNTALLKHYVSLTPALRPVLIAVKRWARAQKLNEARTGGFSSYALANMSIALFQQWGLLPNLQADLPGTVSRQEGESENGAAEHAVWYRHKEREPVLCDVRFRRYSSWDAPVSVTPEQALRGWFLYWAEHHHYEPSIVSIRDTDSLSRPKATTSYPWMTPLCVADPFILTKNLVSQVAYDSLVRFRHLCGVAAEMISQGCTPEALLTRVKVQASGMVALRRKQEARDKRVKLPPTKLLEEVLDDAEPFVPAPLPFTGITAKMRVPCEKKARPLRDQ